MPKCTITESATETNRTISPQLKRPPVIHHKGSLLGDLVNPIPMQGEMGNIYTYLALRYICLLTAKEYRQRYQQIDDCTSFDWNKIRLINVKEIYPRVNSRVFIDTEKQFNGINLSIS